MTYDEFFEGVRQAHMSSQVRLGQMYYLMLPYEISDVIVGTHLDPYWHDYVSDECHDRVRKIWEQR